MEIAIRKHRRNLSYEDAATLAEFWVLALCTEKQRERFLLHALYDFSYEEVGRICGCSKGAVEKSIKSVKNFFKNFGKGVYVRHFKMAIR